MLSEWNLFKVNSEEYPSTPNSFSVQYLPVTLDCTKSQSIVETVGSPLLYKQWLSLLLSTQGVSSVSSIFSKQVV